MNQNIEGVTLLSLSLLASLCGCIAAADAGAPSPAEVPIHFAESPVTPAFGVPAEAQHRHRTGPRDNGPFSSLLRGKVAALNVTYCDSAVFDTPKKAEDFLRLLLSADTGRSWTFQIWSQMLGKPSLTAEITPVEGKPGKLLIWFDPRVIFAVWQDQTGDWWYSGWQDTDKNSLTKQLRQGR